MAGSLTRKCGPKFSPFKHVAGTIRNHGFSKGST
jgi:hypothetical protein